MKITYGTIEYIAAIVMVLGFFGCFYIATVISIFAILSLLVLFGVFFGMMLLADAIVAKGYAYVWDEIEITRRGIERKK